MLEKRALYRTPAGALYRLLDAYPDRSKPVAYVFSMEGKKPLPRAIPYHEFREGVASGEYKKVTASGSMVVKTITKPPKPKKNGDKEEDLTPSEILFRWRCDLIRPLVDNPLIYERKHRGRLVAERALDMKASKQTILTCLRLYWRGGMTFDALMPDFRSCGTPKWPSKRPQGARGRKPKRYKTYQWSDELKPKVVRTLRALLRKMPKASHPLLYRRVLLRHFSTQTIAEVNGKQKTVVAQLPKGERPSRTQLYYLIDKTFSLEERLRQLHGDDNFENNIEPKTGSARQYAAFAGNMYEIDSTKVDCWIVDDADPLTVIGKPTLYLVIDVYTRLIVGFHLTLDSPSWSGAMEALMTLVEDKEKLCERWGFPYEKEMWPAHGVVPAFLRADRGSDFTTYARDVLTDALGIHFVNTPAGKSPTKGTVECSHKLVHIPIKENVGGYTPPEEFGKRRVDDRRAAAARTMKSIGYEILAGIRLNNFKVHRRVELPAAQVWKGEQPIPVRMWELSTQKDTGLHTTREEQTMRFKLLPSDDNFSVTPRGVFYRGLLWLPPKSVEKQWLLPATKGFYKVSATFERRSVAAIYVHDKKDPTVWTTMTLHPEFAQHQGRSWAQFEALEEKKLTLNDLAEEHNLALELQNDLEAEERELAAQAVTRKAIKDAKTKSRTADTTKKRAAAVDKEHAQIPVLPTTAPQAPAPRAPPAATATVLPKASPAPSGGQENLKVVATSANSLLQSLLKLKAKP